MELLKQGQYRPIPVDLQIVSIYGGTKGLFDGLKVSAVGAIQPSLHRYVLDNGAETLERITSTGALDEQTEEELTKLITAAVELFLKENPEAALA
jgi:F-type H+-transporting ATPase subunit alpha